MIKLALQGASVLNIPFTEGLNVAGLLNFAQLETNERSTITVNGREAQRDTLVPDESVVAVTPRIRNG